MTLVVDASIVCKWFVDEANSQQARDVLAGGDTLIAPDLLVAEVCNTLWKKVRLGEASAAQAGEVAAELAGFFDHFAAMAPLASAASDMALRLNHPVYDCFYLALAARENVPLVTADARLMQAVTGSPWSDLVRPLLPATPQSP